MREVPAWRNNRTASAFITTSSRPILSMRHGSIVIRAMPDHREPCSTACPSVKRMVILRQLQREGTLCACDRRMVRCFGIATADPVIRDAGVGGTTW